MGSAIRPIMYSSWHIRRLAYNWGMKTTVEKADPPLVVDMRDAIERSGLTSYALGKAAGVSPTMIDRFRSGQRSLRLDTAGKLAAILRLRIQPE